MLANLFSLLLITFLSTNPISPVFRTAQEQEVPFATKIVNLTLSEISATGPRAEIASFISQSMDLFWPKRYELLKSTEPYIDPYDTSKTSAALDILYRLRSFHPMGGLGFNEEAWEKKQSSFFSELDAAVYSKLNRLLAAEDDSLLRNLALFLGVSRSPASKAALLQLAMNPAVTERALICLGWHKDQKDMDDLLPFMLQGGREAASLPYVFRNSYGPVALPYLLKAVAQANSPFARLEAAFQLIHMNEKAGVKYLFEAVLRREELPNGMTQAGEIRQFATEHMGFPRDSANMEDLLEFLNSKL
jgi:hypothetical protein